MPISPASKSRVRVCQVQETSAGVTPTNPSWKTVPILDNTALDYVKSFARSSQIKANRMGGQQVGGTAAISGPLAVPLKYDTAIRDLMQSAFSGQFANPTVSGTSLAFVTTGTYATASLLFSAQPGAGSTLTLNGVQLTFQTVAVDEYDVAIGATLAATITNLVAVLAGTGTGGNNGLSTNEPSLAGARYSGVSGTTLKIDFKTAGTAGNSYTCVWNILGGATIAGAGVTANAVGSGTLLTGTGTADTITDSQNRFLTLGFRAGQTITVTAATTSGNNQTYVLAAVAAGTLTLDRDIATAEAGVAGTTITSNAFFASAGTYRPTFSYEVTYLDMTPVIYEYFRGMEVNNLSIDIPTSGEVKAQFDLVGLTYQDTITPNPLGSGSRVAMEDVVPFAGSINGAAVIRDGATSVATETCTIKVTNNRDPQYAIGGDQPAFLDQGDFDVEITASIYFISNVTRQRYVAGTRFPIAVTLKDMRDGHQMYMEFPRCVVTAAPKGAASQAITEQVTFFAEEDPTYLTKALLWFIP